MGARSRRTSANAGAALAVAGAVAVAPVTPRLPEAPIVSSAVQLAADSIANVPINLLIDFLNIPANGINGLQMFADSGFFTGTWFVPSATNLWGTDPGDIGHYYALANMALPFPVLANSIAEQYAGYAEAELPVSEWCDAESCLPSLPASPITGFTLIDQGIWGMLTSTGIAPFPLSDNWQQVPISELLNGYTFSEANGYTGYYDPSGPVYANDAWSGPAFEPTTGPDNAMPWAGSTFTLDPSKPFTDFFDSLMADPSTNALQIINPLDLMRAIQSAAAAAVIDFDPFTPGSALCPGHCDLPTFMTVPAIVQAIGNLPPGNDQIDAWLAAWNNGTANWPTAEQIQIQYELLHQPITDQDNPGWPPFGSMPSEPPGTDADPSTAAAGDPDKLLSDLVALLTLNNSDLGQLLEAGGLSGLVSTAAADLSALWADVVGSL